jgi:hypothetical protein
MKVKIIKNFSDIQVLDNVSVPGNL